MTSMQDRLVITCLTGEVRGVNEVVVESSFDENSRHFVSIWWLLRSERAHHLRHLLPPKVQLHCLSISRVVDLHLHVLERRGE